MLWSDKLVSSAHLTLLASDCVSNGPSAFARSFTRSLTYNPVLQNGTWFTADNPIFTENTNVTIVRLFSCRVVEGEREREREAGWGRWGQTHLHTVISPGNSCCLKQSVALERHLWWVGALFQLTRITKLAESPNELLVPVIMQHRDVIFGTQRTFVNYETDPLG